MGKKSLSAAKKKAQTKRQREDDLPWRPNKIRLHREAKGLTQQDVSDRLKREYGISLGRNSVGRIELGDQRPKYVALEAMAKMFGTTVTLMVDYTPEEAQELSKVMVLEGDDRDRLLRAVRAAMGA